jgi:hypothetical protein
MDYQVDLSICVNICRKNDKRMKRINGIINLRMEV